MKFRRSARIYWQVEQSLTVVEGVGRDAITNQADPFDVICLRCLDQNRAAVVGGIRRMIDHRPGTAEKGRAD